MADTGFVIAGAGANVTGIGTEDWANPERITSDDGSYSNTGVMTAGEVSNYLRASTFGFSIPAGATIDGIQMRWALNVVQAADVIDITTVQTVNAAGVIGGTNLGAGSHTGGVEANFDFGGATQLWGRSWGPSDINDSDFGGVLSVTEAGNDANGQCDAMWIKVFYTPAVLLIPPPFMLPPRGPAKAVGY